MDTEWKFQQSDDPVVKDIWMFWLPGLHRHSNSSELSQCTIMESAEHEMMFYAKLVFLFLLCCILQGEWLQGLAEH